MPSRGSLGDALHELLPTSFRVVKPKKKETPIEKIWTEEETEFQLGPDARVLPLCEDMNEGTVGSGDSCWSTCHGQCPNHVLKPGHVFDFDEVKPGHPGCTSHFECVGNVDRILCHAVRSLDAQMPLPVALAAPHLGLHFRVRRQLPRRLGETFL
mmetsp:Transcript_30136/g.54616  ORF Transcript_30136/g.54616 Transcript_30136/m.54616 type:complete len:155 (-) Transcript_30136:14-478(-)